MAATLANMPVKTSVLLNHTGTLYHLYHFSCIHFLIDQYNFDFLANETAVSSPATHVGSVDTKSVFKDKKEAIEAFKEFLKEKVCTWI